MTHAIPRSLIPTTLALFVFLVGCTDAPGVVGGDVDAPIAPPRDLVVETLVEQIRVTAVSYTHLTLPTIE